MRIAALADVLKVILYVIASLFLAAFISPYLFEVGKGFAHVASTKDTVDRVAWLANKAGKADFPAYFNRSLLISGLICLIPFFYSLDLRRHPRRRKSNPWTVGLPPNAIPSEMGQALRRGHWGFLHTLAGFCLATGFALLLAWFLLKLNWFVWDHNENGPQLGSQMWNALKPAIGIALLEEIFFRGALLGIFLRAFRPSAAILLLSLVYASAHFLTPPPEARLIDPQSAGAGFQILTLIGQKFLEMETLIETFISLFLAGLILGAARYFTASLWLPIGLHIGWIFSSKMFDQLAGRRTDFPENFELFMGEKMAEGLIPLGILLMTGIAVAIYLRLTLPKRHDSLME